MAVKLWNGTASTDWSVAGNWTPSGVPTTNDTVYLQNSSISATSGLSQGTVTLTALYISQSFTGVIGVGTNALQIGATTIRIGDPSNSQIQPNGSGRILLDTGTNAATFIVVNTSNAPADSGQAPVRWKGSAAGNKIIAYGGRVEVANNVPGETATVAEVDLQSPNISGATAPVVTLGSGCTLTAINQSAGVLYLNAAATTVTQSAGELTTQGSGAITTLTVGGTAYLNSTGTITTLNVIDHRTADFSGDSQAKTVTTPKAYKGCTINLDNGVKGSITLSNPIALQNCRLSDITLKTWINNTVALA